MLEKNEAEIAIKYLEVLVTINPISITVELVELVSFISFIAT